MRKLWPVNQESERELARDIQIEHEGRSLSVVDWRYQHADAIQKLDMERATSLMRAYKAALQAAGFYLDLNNKNKVLVVDDKYNILQELEADEVKATTAPSRNEGKGKDKGVLDEKKLKAALKQLNSLIGLNDVKERINELVDFIRVQQLRDQAGLPEIENTYHMVFTGNPGTGKTTVARIVGDIFAALGLVSSGHLIEADRSGLVGQHIGATAIKTNERVDEALNGVLFIDEAYALAVDSKNDFGGEALSTLLKRMEDNRKQLVVVMAGYTQEMQAMLNTNPGLRSRFKTIIDFADYSDDEVEAIFTLSMRKHKLRYGVRTRELVRATLAAERAREEHFGNGRSARNLFEETLINQASRLAKMKSPTPRQLSTLLTVDVPAPTH